MSQVLLFQDYSLFNVLNVFFDDPVRDFQLREISRQINLHHKSVAIYIRKLLQLGLIKVNTKTLYESYNANPESLMFLRYKKSINILKIHDSGLIEYLYEKLMPANIIVFGSYAKGIDIKDSDIDIFLETKEEKIDVTKYENKLGRKIHLVFEKNITDLSKELRNNIINGIVLNGNLRLFK